VGEGSNDGKQSSWQFKHPKFQRGQKHMLTDIKRRTYADSSKLVFVFKWLSQTHACDLFVYLLAVFCSIFQM
jgi:hypothetical protein